jgi:hypothetical protein
MLSYFIMSNDWYYIITCRKQLVGGEGIVLESVYTATLTVSEGVGMSFIIGIPVVMYNLFLGF